MPRSWIVEADEYFMQCARRLGETPPAFHMFVLVAADPSAEEGESLTPPPVLGTVALVTIPKVTHGHRAEVVKLLIRPEEQGRGLGKLLMAHVENYAQTRLGKDVLTPGYGGRSAGKRLLQPPRMEGTGYLSRVCRVRGHQTHGCHLLHQILKIGDGEDGPWHVFR